MQQMGNPALQSRHREVIASILKHYQQQQQTSSPRARLILPPQATQQQLSPLPPNGQYIELNFCISHRNLFLDLTNLIICNFYSKTNQI